MTIRTYISTEEDSDGNLIDIEREYDDSIPQLAMPKVDYGLGDEFYPITPAATPFYK